MFLLLPNFQISFDHLLSFFEINGSLWFDDFLGFNFLTNLWARWASFPNWVVSICDWLRTHMIQKLNWNVHLMPSFQMFLTDSSLFLDSFFKSNSLSMMSIFPQMSSFDLWMIVNLSDSDTDLKVSSFTNFLKVILPFVDVFEVSCSLWFDVSLCFSVFSHYVISVMSIFPQMIDFDLWMIINLSDSDTELNVSSFTKFSNVLRPLVVFFEINGSLWFDDFLGFNFSH